MKFVKSLILLFFLTYKSLIVAQITAISGGQRIVMGSAIEGGIYRNKSTNPVKPIGSPYLSENFEEATIENIGTGAKMRFNIYRNEFEFISTANDTLILDKILLYNNIKFVKNNNIYKLVKYPDVNDEPEMGYLQELHQNGILTLFKKENIRFKEEKLGITSLEGNMPAKFYTVKNNFFLKVKSVLINFPDSKKSVLKLFSSKKEAIESFFKINKINFDKENDLIKIVDFLAGL